MLHKSYVIIFVLLLTAVLFTAGTAVASSVDKVSKDNGGYVVTPGKSTPGEIVIMSISSSITQGQYNLHYKTVSGFYLNMPVDLNWGNPSNSLRLKIYSPDGYTFGPFYDNFDGSNDGRVLVNIRNSNGIAQGTWICEVYGYSVTGTQSYTI